MTAQKNQTETIDWSLTTWEGSRKEQLRQWAQLPLENIIAALEEMSDLAQQFEEMRRDGRLRPAQNDE